MGATIYQLSDYRTKRHPLLFWLIVAAIVYFVLFAGFGK